MKNRIIYFVEHLNRLKITSWDAITKEILIIFGCNFRLNKIEVEYLTMYKNNELNFKTKIIPLNILLQIPIQSDDKQH